MPLAERIKLVLDECRMVILGAQVLMAVEYRAAFEEGFSQLSSVDRATLAISIALISGALALLFFPATYHLVVEGGQDTAKVLEIATRVIEVAMAPFAVALGCLCYLAARVISSYGASLAVGIGGASASLFFWYVLPRLRHPSGAEALSSKQQEQDPSVTDLKSKIEHVFQEARMILPGAQALLGFQFASMLTASFGRLPRSVQLIHVAGLLVIALSTILLLAPAAYHRVAERGELTESLHRTAGSFLLSAIACLGLGMAADFGVVVWIISHSAVAAISLAIALLIGAYGMWFGYAFYRRRHPAPSRVLPA